MKFRCYKQINSNDCGPSCIKAIASFYGKNISLSKIRELCNVDQFGTNLLKLSEAANNIGFKTSCLKLSWEQLISNTTVPCIIHWDNHHFIVVYKITPKRVKVSDPAKGLLTYSKQEFCKYWAYSIHDSGSRGFVMTLEPTSLFYKQTDEVSSNKYLINYLKYLKPHKSTFILILLCISLSSLACYLLPLITQAVVDIGIQKNSIYLLLCILIGQFAITFGFLVNDIIKNWMISKTSLKININLSSEFLRKLFCLKYKFWTKKSTGDIIQRFGDVSRIQQFLTSSIFSLTNAIVTFIVYCIISAKFSNKVLIIFSVGSILSFIWILLFLNKRRKIDYLKFKALSKYNNYIVQTTKGISDIKLNCCESKKMKEWQEIQNELYDISIKGIRLQNYQRIGGQIIEQIKNISILFITAYSVIKGNMSTGMMMAMLYIIGQLNGPIYNIISFIVDYQDAIISKDRLNDIINDEEENTINKDNGCIFDNNASICLNNVSFRYNANSPYVLKNISITIPKNKITAIIGASGSGKTTLIKMMLALYKPTIGSIIVGVNDISNITVSSLRSQYGSVLQDSILFNDTILNNISLGSDNVDIKRAKKAASIANIDEFISSLSFGYDTMVGENGSGLSTGQKQRILIARALYNNPKIIILDEATSSLDSQNEIIIANNFHKYLKDKTIIITGHRFNLISRADYIIALDKGIISEQGTPEQLLTQKGLYTKLFGLKE